MRARTSWALCIALAACHRGEKAPAPATSASAVPAPVASLAASAITAARFSRPIAAAVTPGGVTIVAGLVVDKKAIAVTALAADGTTRWTHELISGVTWTANATLAVFPSTSGAFVVWRGVRDGTEGTVGGAIDLAGASIGELFPVGAAACATESAAAWVDRGLKGTWLAKTRPLVASAPSLAVPIPEDRNPVLVCGAHRLFALGEGDDDVTMTTWEGGTRSLPVRIMEDVEFGSDEERGHEVYATGDILGIVRVGSSGRVAAREVDASTGHRGAWHRLPERLAEADDVALVDVDAHQAILAFTSDAGDAGGATRVRALVWSRDGSRDVSYDLAPPDASRVRGPFWSGAVKGGIPGGGIVVAWAERSERDRTSPASPERGLHLDDAAEPPIIGMSYRVASTDQLGELGHVSQAMDDLVDAGCDETRCYAVALARASGEDGGQPETVRVIPYP
jgi:hypothetical protein